MKYPKNLNFLKRSFSSEINFCELYKSKLIRTYFNDYPPLPCYAVLLLHDDEVKNTTCDCEGVCKFDPDDFYGGITSKVYFNTPINLSKANSMNINKKKFKS